MINGNLLKSIGIQIIENSKEKKLTQSACYAIDYFKL